MAEDKHEATLGDGVTKVEGFQPDFQRDPNSAEANVEVRNTTVYPIFLNEIHKLVRAGEVVKVEKAIADRLHQIGVFLKLVKDDASQVEKDAQPVLRDVEKDVPELEKDAKAVVTDK